MRRKIERIPNTICSYCRKEIFKLPCDFRRKSKMYFCDKNCRMAYFVGKNCSSYECGLLKVKCDQCGADINIKRNRFKEGKLFFCDYSCMGQYKSRCKNGIKNDNYKELFKCKCEYCGKIIYKSPYHLKNFNHHFCDMKCYSLWHIGENSGKWISNRFLLKSSIRATVVQFKWYKEWIKNVYKMDKYTCFLCGSKNRKLNAHHIISFFKIIDSLDENQIKLLLENSNIPEILLDINNGITLCYLCHRKIRGKEDLFLYYFSNLVRIAI